MCDLVHDVVTLISHLSIIMWIGFFAFAKTKVQIRWTVSMHAADQHLCIHCKDSTIPLLSGSEISSFFDQPLWLNSLVCVECGWKPKRPDFLRWDSFVSCYITAPTNLVWNMIDVRKTASAVFRAALIFQIKFLPCAVCLLLCLQLVLQYNTCVHLLF